MEITNKTTQKLLLRDAQEIVNKHVMLGDPDQDRIAVDNGWVDDRMFDRLCEVQEQMKTDPTVKIASIEEASKQFVIEPSFKNAEALWLSHL